VLVERGLASAEIVVVDGGEVVVHEAEGVDEFDGGAGVERAFTVRATSDGGVPREDGAEALATLEERVTDRTRE